MRPIGHDYPIDAKLLAILEELAQVTGLESIYLTRISWSDHQQEILGAANLAPSRLFIPEEVKIDYSDAVCRYVIEGGPAYTDDVPIVYPQSDMARFLGFQSFVSAPIEVEDGTIFGTLCGASTRRVKLSEAQLAEVRRRARLIGSLLRETGDVILIDPA
jgi:diguanylate cyclase